MYKYIYIIHKCMHIYRIRMNSDGVFHVFPMLTHPIVHPVPNLFSAKNGENWGGFHSAFCPSSGDAGLQDMIHPFKDTQMGKTCINWHWYAPSALDIYTVSKCIESKQKKTPHLSTKCWRLLERNALFTRNTWHKKVPPTFLAHLSNIFFGTTDFARTLHPAVGSSQTLGLVQCGACRWIRWMTLLEGIRRVYQYWH